MTEYDITGHTFGYWKVLRKDDPRPNSKNSRWVCKCRCGNVRSVIRTSLLNGRSQSCGCRPSENRKGINKTHGDSKTRLYHEWSEMKRRCKSPNGKCSHLYYGKGITVCKEWESYENFRTWSIENGYSDTLTIDRIDNDKGYSPENCRWVTPDEQQRNKTNNIFVEYNNEMRCLRDICNQIGFPYKTANRRYNRAKKAGKLINTEKLFEPIHEEKIAHRYKK